MPVNYTTKKNCSCKKGCLYKQCYCFREGLYCSLEACGCTNCANYAPDYDDDDNEGADAGGDDSEGEEAYTTVSEDTDEDEGGTPPCRSMTCADPMLLARALNVVSWNLCHFTTFRSDLSTMSHQGKKLTADMGDKLWEYTEQAIRQLQKEAQADIFVLQELPRNQDRQARIELFMSCLDDRDKYQFSDDADSEHLFVWNTQRVRTKPHMDKTQYLVTDKGAHPLVKDGVKRTVCTMQFFVDGLRLIVSSLHLKSGGGKETVDNLRELVRQYPERASARYGFHQPNTLHVLAGDFNLNPHEHRKLWEHDWVATGNEFTQTSAGGKGYDFFMVYQKSTAKGKVGFYQREFVQTAIKNPSKGQLGISDHDPIVLSIYPYARLTDSPSVQSGGD